jgi:putative PEP-CTERM system integral membrane protein
MTWKTLSVQQRWPLPHLSLKRNIYWDQDTVRLVNNTPFQVIDASDWMHPFVDPSAPPLLEAHQVHLAGGYSISAEPAERADRSSLPDDTRLAVVVDRSRSMQEIEPLVRQAMTQLSELVLAQPIDLYLTASAFRGEDPVMVSLPDLSSQMLEFLGGQNPAQLLAQFAEMRAGRAYDAVIVLTDGSGYELGQSQYDIPAFDMPVWMVHLGDRIPLGYDDKTLEAIQSSQGGIVGSLDEALGRVAASHAAQDTAGAPLWRDMVDGYIWTIQQQDETAPDLSEAPNGFSSLAARRVLLVEIQQARGKLDDLKMLDQLHAIASAESIITPYSSMIVLVNPEQEKLLRSLSQKDDRYQREVEDLGETTPATQMALTGVPEPEEWLLIAAAALLLAYTLLTRRPGFVRS